MESFCRRNMPKTANAWSSDSCLHCYSPFLLLRSSRLSNIPDPCSATLHPFWTHVTFASWLSGVPITLVCRVNFHTDSSANRHGPTQADIDKQRKISNIYLLTDRHNYRRTGRHPPYLGLLFFLLESSLASNHVSLKRVG